MKRTFEIGDRAWYSAPITCRGRVAAVVLAYENSILGVPQIRIRWSCRGRVEETVVAETRLSPRTIESPLDYV